MVIVESYALHGAVHRHDVVLGILGQIPRNCEARNGDSSSLLGYASDFLFALVLAFHGGSMDPPDGASERSGQAEPTLFPPDRGVISTFRHLPRGR